jgi:hypothetical protein
VAETKPKPKLNKKAVEMRKQEPKIRAKNFNEVALGYTEAEAQEEAARCLSSVHNWLPRGSSDFSIHQMHQREEVR